MDIAKLDAIAFQDAHIMALAHAVDNLYRYHHQGPELQVELVRMIARYDFEREQQIRNLMEQLIDALEWSVKPALELPK